MYCNENIFNMNYYDEITKWFIKAGSCKMKSGNL